MKTFSEMTGEQQTQLLTNLFGPQMKLLPPDAAVVILARGTLPGRPFTGTAVVSNIRDSGFIVQMVQLVAEESMQPEKVEDLGMQRITPPAAPPGAN